jgi:hypothetical protein
MQILIILYVLKQIQDYTVAHPQKRKKVDDFNFNLVKMCIEKIEIEDIELFSFIKKVFQ